MKYSHILYNKGFIVIEPLLWKFTDFYFLNILKFIKFVKLLL